MTCARPAGFYGQLGHGTYESVESPKELCIGYQPSVVRCFRPPAAVLRHTSIQPCPARAGLAWAATSTQYIAIVHACKYRRPLPRVTHALLPAGRPRYGGGDHPSCGGLWIRVHGIHHTPRPAYDLGLGQPRRAGPSDAACRRGQLSVVGLCWKQPSSLFGPCLQAPWMLLALRTLTCVCTPPHYVVRV